MPKKQINFHYISTSFTGSINLNTLHLSYLFDGALNISWVYHVHYVPNISLALPESNYVFVPQNLAVSVLTGIDKTLQEYLSSDRVFPK